MRRQLQSAGHTNAVAWAWAWNTHTPQHHNTTTPQSVGGQARTAWHPLKAGPRTNDATKKQPEGKERSTTKSAAERASFEYRTELY